VRIKNGTGNGYRECIPGIVLTLLIAAGCAPPTPPLALPAETTALRTPSPVTSVALAKTQPLMATIGQDHMLRVVSLPDGAEQQKFDLTGRTIDMFALAPTGAIVLVGDHTGRVTIWDTGTGTIRFKFTLPRYPGVAVFSRDGAGSRWPRRAIPSRSSTWRADGRRRRSAHRPEARSRSRSRAMVSASSPVTATP
jgi:hypothetical protein